MIHKPKKSLGQNFLKSQIALRKIVEAGEIGKEDIILEIGPGKGVLTKELLKYAKLVIAIEKDDGLFLLLKEKFKKEIESRHLVLVRDDILKFDVKKTVLSFGNGLAGRGTRRTENLRKTPKQFSYKIIANIPYNITGAILKKFLTANPPAGGQPERMILMVQHEVAKRIVANDKKESILSISVKAYGKPKMIMKVPARYFSPSPKVDSAVIAITDISRKIFKENVISEEKFWEIVKKGFAHKRKKLSGNLKNLILDKNTFLKEFGDKRAENLTLSDWIMLATRK